MANCAVIQNIDGSSMCGTVINTIVADVTDTAPDGCFLVEMTADNYGGPGWFYDGELFQPPLDLGGSSGWN